MKHVFVINPMAGKKDSESYIPIIEDYFKDKKEEYEFIISQSRGHATEAIKKYHKEDDVCIYAVGGDGTAYEVLNGINEGVSMAVIPNGTGNDYYRNYHMPEGLSIKDIIIKTIEGRNVLVDYGVVNERKYLNSSSMGIDADVNDEANRIGKKYPIPKSLVYIVAAIKTALKPNPIDFTLDIDGQQLKTTALLAAVMNGQYYGGGFLPTPTADLQDGKLDVCIAKSMKTSRIFVLLPKYMKGEHTDLEEIIMTKAEKVTMDVKTPVLYGCDGEPIKATHLEYHIEKAKLSLRVPNESIFK